jgi:hypothetical protein
VKENKENPIELGVRVGFAYSVVRRAQGRFRIRENARTPGRNTDKNFADW